MSFKKFFTCKSSAFIMKFHNIFRKSSRIVPIDIEPAKNIKNGYKLSILFMAIIIISILASV